jgi:hypothetical protein
MTVNYDVEFGVELKEELIKMQDLPAEIQLEIPESNNPFATLCNVVGFVLLIVGILFIFFGPETIYYNMLEGMTFLQFLQSYPGPIATVGGGLVYIGSHLATTSVNKANEMLQQQLDARLEISDSDIPEGHSLAFTALGNNRFRVDLAEDVAEDEISEKTPVKS